MDTPVVSILIPAFNAMETLPRCLEHIRRLSPASPSHEIIIIDNRSTDGTWEFLQNQKGIIALQEKDKQSAAAAHNKGIQQAKGKVIAFLDADCLVVSDWLVKGYEPFTKGKVGGVAGDIRGIPAETPVQAWMIENKIFDASFALHHPFKPFIQNGNAFYWRDDVLAVNGYDEDIIYGEDADLGWRILDYTGRSFVYVPEAAVYHINHRTVGQLFKQSRKNVKGGIYLARKWKEEMPKKKWKTSVWECEDLLLAGGAYLKSLFLWRPLQERQFRWYDFVHRLARKIGTIEAAVKFKQWDRW